MNSQHVFFNRSWTTTILSLMNRKTTMFTCRCRATRGSEWRSSILEELPNRHLTRWCPVYKFSQGHTIRALFLPEICDNSGRVRKHRHIIWKHSKIKVNVDKNLGTHQLRTAYEHSLSQNLNNSNHFAFSLLAGWHHHKRRLKQTIVENIPHEFHVYNC